LLRCVCYIIPHISIETRLTEANLRTRSEDIEITVTEEESSNQGTFLANGGLYSQEAELTYKRGNDKLTVCEHTRLSDALTGRVGLKLIEAAVADARIHRYQIVPQSFYIRHLSRQYPEWDDVFVRW